jgi:hypothetical protein
MREQQPERCRSLHWHIAHQKLRDCPAEIQVQVDAALDWIADQLPFPIVVPRPVLDALRDVADLPWISRRLDPTTIEFAPELLTWASEESDRVEILEEEDRTYADGRRAARLTDESPSWNGRFSQIGIDGVAAAFQDNGPRHGYVGNSQPERWRTRERRRRPRSLTDPGAAERLLTSSSGVSVTILRSVLRRGRPTREQQVVREVLARAVRELRAKESVAVSALAAALQCDPATIWRLAGHGAAKNARPRDIEGDGAHLSAAA